MKTAPDREQNGNFHVLAMAVLLAVFSAFPLSQARAGDEQKIIENVQSSFDETRAMTASFTQTVETKGFGEVKKFHGVMSMLKPSMMRWDYDNPKGRRLVVDGERLWFYDPEENVVHYDELSGFLSPKSPALFLAGEEKLENLFEIYLVKTAGKKERDLIELKLVPKEPQPGLKAMLLTLDGDTYSVRELLMVDHLGAKNRITFTGVDRSVSLDKSMFTFDPPAGAPVRAIPGAGG